jgi:hypothetical protein
MTYARKLNVVISTNRAEIDQQNRFFCAFRMQQYRPDRREHHENAYHTCCGAFLQFPFGFALPGICGSHFII